MSGRFIKELVGSPLHLLQTFAGVGCAVFGLTAFLQPAKLIDGGVTGLSMLISHITGIPLYALILLVNLPFLLLGLLRIGSAFFVRATVAIAALSIALANFHFQEMTHDPLLAAVFGGMFIGAGIALSIRGRAVIDGTEILALFLSRTGFLTIGNVILLFNIGIFLIAAFFLGKETAMYSILTYLSASKTLDFVLYGLDEYFGVMIVSTQSDEIRLALLNELGRGVTRLEASSGLMNEQLGVLYSVVTRLEISALKSLCRNIDPRCFLVVSPVTSVEGGTVPARVSEAIK
jgi:uncharacterized membrane-anchored protein YitT (DUF2179 family)